MPQWCQRYHNVNLNNISPTKWDRFWSFLLIWYQEILYFKTQSYTDTEHFPIRHGGCSALSSTPCLTLEQTMFWAYDIVSYCMGYDILYNICMYIMHVHAPFMHCTCMYMHVYAYIHAVHRYIMIMYMYSNYVYIYTHIYIYIYIHIYIYTWQCGSVWTVWIMFI